jgi:uncharacterized protein
MKFLLLVALVVVIFWLIRRSGRSEQPAPRSARQEPAQQQEMVQCPVCLVHVPRSDALPGPDGQLYCCAEHRRRAEA